MRKIIFCLGVFLASFVYGDEKIYLPFKNLSFGESGILFKKGKCVFELPLIKHNEQGYYLCSDSQNDMTIIQCGYCKHITWWVEGHCCFREDCPYFCYCE